MNMFEPHGMSSYSSPTLDSQKRVSSLPTIVMSVLENNITQTKKSANKHQHIKRPRNSYMLWSRDRRQEISLANPNLRNSEISKQLGAEWRLLTIQEKQPFIDEAKRLQEQHMIDNPDYKYRPRRKRKSVKNTFEPSVVPHSLSSYSSTTFEAEELMSNPHVSANDAESKMLVKTLSEQNDCGHVLNLSNFVVSNTSSPSLNPHGSPELLQQTGEYLFYDYL